jgi:outer membrane immunogenic protein
MKTKLIAAIAALVLIPVTTASAQVLTRTSAGANSESARSWAAGILAGYNWQNGNVVYGVETDATATTLKTDFNTILTGTVLPPPTANTNAEVEWYGTARGRLGFAAGPVLFYGTGGLAYGNINLNSTLISGSNVLGAQISEAKIGWVGGFGLEYKATPNVIFTLAYQYVDLGTARFDTPIAISGLTQMGSAHAQFQVVTLGLSWLFSPTDNKPHGAWEGGYIGGRAGGDWGNHTSADYAATQVLLSDIRVKRDITRIGQLDDGLGLYRYRYLWSDTVYVGVMAQEVADLYPDAVVRGDDGYLRVNYARLGLSMRTQAEWDALTYGIALD